MIITTANLKHLMLRWDVVHAAQTGQFHIHAVATVDEALELLTGLTAGSADDKDNYPANTFNGLVEVQLVQFALIKKDISSAKKANP
ncbi:MAG: hypothetical protein ACXWTP_05310 [Methylosarcina sp.]